MVTATNGTVRFKGLKTGELYGVNIYIADVIGTRCKFSTRGKAAATDPETVQFNEPVQLYDVSLASGPTVTTALIPTSAAVEIQNKVMAIADVLNSAPLGGRAIPIVKWKSGSLIGFKEA